MLRMEHGLNLEQSQKLIMTPELQQAINILQFSALELAEYLQQQVTENPVLELQETEEKEQLEKLLEPEVDWKEVFSDKSDLGASRVPKEIAAAYSLEHYLSEDPSLWEHLKFQLDLLNLKPSEYAIGRYIIGNIDHNGYLQAGLPEVSAKCGCSTAQAEAMLAKIQGFDPLGVGARNLGECLLLQLRAQEESDPLAEKIIEDHLEDLAGGKWAKIARLLDATLQEVQKASGVIKGLNPKPGSKFAACEKPRYLVADVVVENIEGEYIILLNDGAVPRLTINPLYERLVKSGEGDSDTIDFLEQKLSSALWLLKSIEQRRLTLYKVAGAILDYQKDFFNRGVKYLKPLTLRQVAEQVGVHESTVSRATANKYLQTPRGIFEFKYFFASGVENWDGTTASAESIKAFLKELLAVEDVKKPLSDQKLAEILTDRGINIARRTVAKYRGEMGIPTALQRKRY